MRRRTFWGRIRYLGDEVGERGRELFIVTVYGDGSRTVRAMCEMDDSEVIRDVTYTVDAAFRPVDAFVRLRVEQAFRGVAWFRFGTDVAECEGFNQGDGRVSQRVELERPARSFGPHPVVCDAWHLAAYDTEGPPKQPLADTFVSSTLPDGSSGPMLETMDVHVEHLGRERISVPAGEFDTEHFAFHLSGQPDEHVWVVPGDWQMIKIRWDLLSTTYELVELREGTP